MTPFSSNLHIGYFKSGQVEVVSSFHSKNDPIYQFRAQSLGVKMPRFCQRSRVRV